MSCYICKKPILDEHFKKTRKYYYHLDECWWKSKKFYHVIVPLVFSTAFLWGIVVLILSLILGGLL